ncbi:MAG: efflux RND transporter permease subunit [Elusimicrobiota bacterium]|nr:efflux RND transporter permease subunit [Elusimicrobiota bacterium]
MAFIKLAVERKVTILMIYLGVFLLGLLAWSRLDREFMPNLEFPRLMVLTNYENASSQEVENLITKIVEEACGTVKGVKRIYSVSKEGISIVTVEFIWGTNMDFASLNLREKIDLTKMKLPREASEPQIEKFNPFALPVLILSLTGEKSNSELFNIAKKPVVDLIEKLPKVAAVSIIGGLEREIKVELEQEKLANHEVSILQVGESISRSNIEYPAGTVEDKTFQYLVRVMGSFKAVYEINDVVVKVDRGYEFTSSPDSSIMARDKNKKTQKEASSDNLLVLLSSLGTVKDSFKKRTSFSRYNNKDNITLAVLKQGDANIVDVAETLKKKLPEIQEKLPTGVKLEIVYDQSIFIKKSINDMISSGISGGILCFIVLYLFLGNYKNALIVNTVIPTSLLITLFLLYTNKISLNTISLSALVIGVGLLTDGAIIIIENITRYKEQKLQIKEATVIGTSELIGPIISSIGTTIVVFLPLVFVTGIIGQVFRDFSLSVVFSQLSSIFVYFTLLPMLVSLVKSSDDKNFLLDKFDSYWGRFLKMFKKLLFWGFKNSSKALIYVFIAFLLSLILMFFLEKELFPKVDQGEFIINLNMPIKTKLEITNNVTKKIEKIVNDIKEVEGVSVTVGGSSDEGLQSLEAHQSKLVIKVYDKRRKSTDEIIQELQEKLEDINLLDGQVIFSTDQGGAFGVISDGGSPIVVEAKLYDLNKLDAISKKVEEELEKISGVYNIKSSLNLRSKEIGIDIRRNDLASYSLSGSDVAETLLAAIKGKVVSKFREEGKEIDIRMILNERDRDDISSINRLLINSPLDINIPLEAIANVNNQLGPNEILRYDGQRTVLISAALFKKSFSKVRLQINEILEKLKKEYPDLSIRLGGAATQMDESFGSMKIVILLSILLVYMIMAAQFESFWQPLLIMVTIPFSIIGMAPALFLTGNSISAMAGIGMILLVRIVVNNGIVLIDFTNSEMKRGLSLRTSLWRACNIRLRPIMMTAMTTVFGLLPLALGLSKEAKMQSPMAITVISGFFVSTFLTLIILPIFYMEVDSFFKKKNKIKNI